MKNTKSFTRCKKSKHLGEGVQLGLSVAKFNNDISILPQNFGLFLFFSFLSSKINHYKNKNKKVLSLFNIDPVNEDKALSPSSFISINAYEQTSPKPSTKRVFSVKNCIIVAALGRNLKYK